MHSIFNYVTFLHQTTVPFVHLFSGANPSFPSGDQITASLHQTTCVTFTSMGNFRAASWTNVLVFSPREKKGSKTEPTAFFTTDTIQATVISPSEVKCAIKWKNDSMAAFLLGGGKKRFPCICIRHRPELHRQQSKETQDNAVGVTTENERAVWGEVLRCQGHPCMERSH